MARSLVENLTEPWDPAAFKDEYRDALLELIDRKLAGGVTAPEALPEPAPVVDLLRPAARHPRPVLPEPEA
jgi:DNA end-binding protein Ku